MLPPTYSSHYKHRRFSHYVPEKFGEEIKFLGLCYKMESTSPLISQRFLGSWTLRGYLRNVFSQ